MNHRVKLWKLIALCGLTLAGCHTATPSASLVPPAAPREFRAAWVATVDNIDWPSKPGLNIDEQQKEAIAILDRASELHLNAIVLQVRTSCDAFYDSKLEPWSEYLTGTQGQAPKPYYDPLEFWVNESHKRGIELHAWLNPYRARSTAAHGPDAPNHISKTNPSIVKSFNGWEWLDPGEPAAAKLTLDVFKDLAHRYDIDGVHMDDYFYPYPEYLTDKKTKKTEDFPDEASYARYQKSGGKLNRNDWRRKNVDDLVEQIDKTVHAEKPTVLFGISPFGLGRPDKRPPGISGFSQYDLLYADVETWLANDWCDYLTPQLYWPIDKKEQAFPTLVSYWKPLMKSRHLWPGLYTSKAIASTRPSTSTTKPINWTTEITNEIDVTRQQLGNDAGQVHFSFKALQKDNNGLTQALMTEQYKVPALVPASPWRDSKPPAKPNVKVVGVGSSTRSVKISPAWPTFEKPWLYAIWTKANGGWTFHVQPASNGEIEIDTNVSAVVVTAVDHSGNESERVTVEIKAN